MTFTLLKSAAPLLVTTMLVAVPAWAQSTPPSAGTAPSGTVPSATSPLGGMAGSSSSVTTPSTAAHASSTMARHPGESLETMVDHRITQLHTQLHITPAQNSQWDQFTQVMRDNAKSMDQMYADRAQKLSGMSAVDNMQSFGAIEQARAEGMQKLVPAFQTLYTSLSDQQKQQADALFRYQAAKAEAHKPAGAAHQG